MYNLPENHINGRVFVRLSNSSALSADEYFSVIDKLRDLFNQEDFKNSTPGFYINYIKGTENAPNGGLRLSYYTTNASQTIKIIEDFISNHPDLEIFEREHADDSLPIDQYDGGSDESELRFRNFLNSNTHIVLDILDNFSVVNLRNFVNISRMILVPQRINPRRILEPIFKRHSGYFKELKEENKSDLYWEDLISIHRESDPGIHFLVNIIIGQETGYDFDTFDSDNFT